MIGANRASHTLSRWHHLWGKAPGVMNVKRISRSLSRVRQFFGLHFSVMYSKIACLALLMAVGITVSAQDCETTVAAHRKDEAPTKAPGDGPVGQPWSYKIGHGVTVPILKKFISPAYPEDALKAHYGGSVLLRVVVGTDGVPLNAQVGRSLGFGLDQAAANAVKQWQFTPGELETILFLSMFLWK